MYRFASKGEMGDPAVSTIAEERWFDITWKLTCTQGTKVTLHRAAKRMSLNYGLNFRRCAVILRFHKHLFPGAEEPGAACHARAAKTPLSHIAGI
jgi:hypothetical protein